ncbi:MAG: hypothetical protein K1060chlam4_00100 [Candidatus Anoxychlamydiales bacterium]|nr:hypothetical protein [Candidatus Anoxychlamydiales bacterium]
MSCLNTMLLRPFVDVMSNCTNQFGATIGKNFDINPQNLNPALRAGIPAMIFLSSGVCLGGYCLSKIADAIIPSIKMGPSEPRKPIGGRAIVLSGVLSVSLTIIGLANSGMYLYSPLTYQGQ